MEEKMKGIVFVGPQKVEIRELVKPKITPYELLLKTEAVAICTVEQRTFKSDNRQPSLGGHEVCCTVVEVGEDIRGFEVGEKVVSTFQYCGYCENCKTGNGQKCLNARTQKKRIIDENIGIGNGGMAEYAAVPANQVCKVGQNVPIEYAALTEPLACCLHSVSKTRAEYGETAVVIGAGIMGLLHIKLLNMRGCRVIVSELDEKRRAKAIAAGAKYAIDPSKEDVVESIKALTDGKGADIVINTTSIYQVGLQAIEMLAHQGRLIAYASLHPAEPISLDLNKLHQIETEVIGTVSPREVDFFRASKLMQYQLIDMADVIEGTYKFKDAQLAFEDSIRPDTYRCIITF